LIPAHNTNQLTFLLPLLWTKEEDELELRKHTHTLTALSSVLAEDWNQNVVARATFSIALLPNLYKLATNYKVQDGMAEYSPPSP
jgi:hypothetical protein